MYIIIEPHLRWEEYYFTIQIHMLRCVCLELEEGIYFDLLQNLLYISIVVRTRYKRTTQIFLVIQSHSTFTQLMKPNNTTIYTRPGCPYCSKIKEFYNLKGWSYREHILNENFTRDQFYKEFGSRVHLPTVSRRRTENRWLQ